MSKQVDEHSPAQYFISGDQPGYFLLRFEYNNKKGKRGEEK